MSETENSDREEYSNEESDDYEDGSSRSSESTGSSSNSKSGDSEADSEEEEEEETEPVLKYKRFARDVVASISQGHGGEESNVICCMAVHSKVSVGVRYLGFMLDAMQSCLVRPTV